MTDMYGHRIDDTLPVRILRGVVYVGLSIAGLVGVFIPPPALDHYLTPAGTAVWAVYLTLGGIGALTGVLLDEWFGEFVFLSLLICGVGLYGILVLVDAATDPAKSVAGVLLLVLTLTLIVRWLTVRADAKRGLTRPHNPERG